jgi:tetratricopeptide (TPR) repeat protein
VLRSETVPSWGSLEAVVVALDGDAAEFKRFWIAARDDLDSGTQSVPIVANRRALYRGEVPSYEAARINLVSIYHSKGQHDKCFELFSGWIGRYAELDATMLGELCHLHLYSPQHAEVVARYDYDTRKRVALSATIEDVDTVDSCVHWARFCENMDRLDKAMQWAARARIVNPHSIKAMRVHADIMMSAGRYEESADLFLRASRLDDNNENDVVWHVSLEHILKLTGRLSELEAISKARYERSIQRAGNVLFNLIQYISTLRVSGNLDEAGRLAPALKRLIDENEAPGWARIEYAELMEDLRDIEAAKEVLLTRSGAEDDEDLAAAYANLIYRVEGAEAATPLLIEWAEAY